MSRGVLPSYERLAHVPNILEAYRYLTRRNLSTLCSELAMSYHTIRRVCTQWAAPRDTTLEQIGKTLDFVTKENWITGTHFVTMPRRPSGLETLCLLQLSRRSCVIYYR